MVEANLLLDLGLIVVTATFFSYLARLLKQPSILAYIIAGVFIGPIGLGAYNIVISGVPLGITSLTEIRILSELGIAFLLFSVGVESDISKLIKTGKVVLFGTILQVLIIIFSVFFISQYLGLFSFNESIYLGVILAFSSTMIVVKILADNFQIDTLQGRLMIGFLLVQDFLVIIAVPLLSQIQSIFSPVYFVPIILKGVALIAAAFLLSKFVFPRVFRFSIQSQELLFLAGVSSCFIFIYLSYLLNFSIAIGAFIAGLSISTLPYNLEIYSKIRGLRDFFVTIFFVSLGMQLTFSFTSFPLIIPLMLFVIVFLIKPLIFFIITLFSGYGGKTALAVALGLAQVSEFSFIIASQGHNPLNPAASVLSAELFSLIIFTIAISMVVTPYLMNFTPNIYRWLYTHTRRFSSKLEKSSFFKKVWELERLPAELQNHIVIVGAGTMGNGIASALHNDFNVVVIDRDPEVVKSCIREGINTVYGAADSEDVLQKVNLKKARLLIIAMPEIKTAKYIIDYTKKINEKIVIFARAHYYRDALLLYESGADYVLMPHVIGANVFLKNVATFLETGKLFYISKFKEEYMKYLREKAEEEKEHFGI